MTRSSSEVAGHEVPGAVVAVTRCRTSFEVIDVDWQRPKVAKKRQEVAKKDLAGTRRRHGEGSLRRARPGTSSHRKRRGRLRMELACAGARSGPSCSNRSGDYRLREHVQMAGRSDPPLLASFPLIRRSADKRRRYRVNGLTQCEGSIEDRRERLASTTPQHGPDLLAPCSRRPHRARDQWIPTQEVRLFERHCLRRLKGKSPARSRASEGAERRTESALIAGDARPRSARFAPHDRSDGPSRSGSRVGAIHQDRPFHDPR